MVLILVDDLRWDALGALGLSPVPTPNMDRLADEGMLFEQSFVVQSVCSPSRASIFTGLYPHAHEVRTNHDDWNQGQKNIMRALEGRGYRIGYVGKWHLGGMTPPDWADRWVSFRGQGEYIDPVLDIDGSNAWYRGHLTEILTDHAIDFLQSAKDSPFFLVLSHKAAHAPFVPQERWRGTVDVSSFEIPASFEEDLQDQPAFVRERSISGDASGLRRRMQAYYELVLGVDAFWASIGSWTSALPTRSPSAFHWP